MEREYFDNKVPHKIYKKLNKDYKVRSFFYSNSIGRLMEIFDDYYQLSEGVITKKGWHDYCLSQVDRNILLNAARHIKFEYGIDWKDASQYVYYRTVGQTWNGMQEEMSVITQLSEYFPLIDFEKAPYELDERYFTDWQGFSGEDLLFGIQVKPHTYKLMNSAYQVKSKENHSKQKEEYKQKYKVGHFMVYYKDHKIEDKKTLLNRIDTYLAYNIRIK